MEIFGILIFNYLVNQFFQKINQSGIKNMTNKDPLLQPFQLKHLTLRNRIMSTAHEPAYSEDGMPKDRYRLYHVPIADHLLH